MAAMGRVSPSSRPVSSLKRPPSTKHVAMLTGSDRAHSSSSAGESQSQDQTQAHAQVTNPDDSATIRSDSPAQPSADAESVFDPSSAAQEAKTAAEQEAAAAAVLPSSSKLSFTMRSVIDQTVRRQMSSVYGDASMVMGSPRVHVGQGFAKWISRAVGNAALKEKTEIEDLPAYKLRVCCQP